MEYPESQSWKAESMELGFWWIICCEVDAFADVDHHLNKHDYRQQNGPGGVVCALWTITSPICTKFLQACRAAALCLQWSACQLHRGSLGQQKLPRHCCAGSSQHLHLKLRGELLLPSVGLGARPLLSYLQYSKMTPTWTGVCMDYQSTALLVLSNFHSFLLHNVLSILQDVAGRMQKHVAVFPAVSLSFLL